MVAARAGEEVDDGTQCAAGRVPGVGVAKSCCAFKRTLFVRRGANADTTQSLLNITVVLRRAAENHIFCGQPEAGTGSNMSGNPTQYKRAPLVE